MGLRMSARARLVDCLGSLPGKDALAERVDRADHNLHRCSILMTAIDINLATAVGLLREAGYIDESKAAVSA
jgi:hypothetical protein